VLNLDEDELVDYIVEVYRQRCDTRSCGKMDYLRPLCSEEVTVGSGGSATVTIELLRAGESCGIATD
jgi:hypothetical protein